MFAFLLTSLYSTITDKISSPNALLGRLGGVRGLVKEKGVLVVISGFQWNEDTTPKSLWLGGHENGDISSEPALVSRLSADFSLVSRTQAPVFWQDSVRTIRARLLSVLILRRNGIE